MINFGAFETTVTKAAATAISFVCPAPTGARARYAISSDAAIHMDRLATATNSSARVPANTVVLVELFGGDTLSFIKETGATDGTIWITKVGY